MKSIATKISIVICIIIIATNTGISQNIVLNSGFEEGTGLMPENWSTIVSEGSANFSWVADTYFSGSKSICISHSDSATSSFYQVIPVLPGYGYSISGYIKTSDADTGGDWFEGGAQIVIEGDVEGYWWDNMTERIAGTSDWQKVELEFTTTDDAAVIELHCRLGAGLKIKGTAWFDDIVMEETVPSGKYFRNGGFEEDTLILNREDPNWAGGWFLEFDEFSSVEEGYVTISLDTIVCHEGNQSLKFYCVPDRPTGWMQVMQNGGPYPEGFIDGAYYKVSGWIKTAGDVSHIRMRCGDNGDVGEQLAGENDWTYREGIVKFEQSFYNMWGFLGLTFFKENTSNSGTVWYDDIKVERVPDTRISGNQERSFPTTAELVGNYPNPFPQQGAAATANPTTTFVFNLNIDSNVKITIYNFLGQKIADVVNKRYQAGEYKIKWDAGNELPSGVYFYELIAENFRQTQKMILLR